MQIQRNEILRRFFLGKPVEKPGLKNREPGSTAYGEKYLIARKNWGQRTISSKY